MHPTDLAISTRTGEAFDTLEDPSTCSDVVLEYYNREFVSLRRYLSFRGIDSDSARDILQEAFLRLHDHLLRGGDRSNLRAWLYRVVHNLAQNRRTSGWARLTASSNTMSEPRSSAASPEQAILERERDTRLAEAMSVLPIGQRECMILRAQGLTYREIGMVLALSTSTVAEHVQRAIAELRGSL